MGREPTFGDWARFRQHQQRQFAGGILWVLVAVASLIALPAIGLWIWFVVINGVVP